VLSRRAALAMETAKRPNNDSNVNFCIFLRDIRRAAVKGSCEKRV
jgi:hypothetical protein